MFIIHESASCKLLIFYDIHLITIEQTQFILLYVPYILQNVTVFVQQINNIYKYGNVRQCCKEQTFLIYIVRFLENNNTNQSTLQAVHSIQSHVLRCTLTSEDLWSPKICLFALHTSTPQELTAVADTHTEHSQLPHVHVNSCTCRSTVLYYTVVLLCTGRNILSRNSITFVYFQNYQ